MKIEPDKPLLFAYLRVSSHSQHLGRQKVAIKEYCKQSKNKIDPNYIFTEKISGKNTKRPALQRMLKTLKLFKGNKGHRAVVIEAPDRLSRNAKDMKRLINKIRSYGATVIFTCIPQFIGLPQDLRDMLDGVLICVFSYTAQHERRMIKARQAQGIELARKNGKYHGRKPIYNQGSKGYYHMLQAFHDYINKNTNGMTTTELCRKNNVNIHTFYSKFRHYRKTHKHYQTDIYDYLKKK